MILTGRAVFGGEALQMGLANRMTPRGKALDAALELAESLCEFPQNCMRSDRLSSYEQWSLGYVDAMKNELRRGQSVLSSGETVAGASRFKAGHGRHGSFK
jgi:enoyl-CoA hydratase